MATSGSVDFNPTRDDIIKAALRLCGVIDAEETPTGSEISDAAQALNVMIKSWQSRGIGLWANQECTLFLEIGKTKYYLGTASGADHCTASHVETTTSGDEAISSTVIGLTSSSGMTAGDFIGIMLDSGILHWTTIATVDSSVQVTTTSGLASAASSGATVFSYTSKINRPLKIVEARLRQATSSVAGDGTDIPLWLISRTDYAGLSAKSSSGVPLQAFYDPQLTLGAMNVWPSPNSESQTIRMTIKRPLEDVDLAANTFDFPQEWFRALKYGLAVELGFEYSISPPRLDRLAVLAEKFLDEVSGAEIDGESFSFYPSEY
jgi:hypothetical protein